jgi:hypothetical protein
MAVRVIPFRPRPTPADVEKARQAHIEEVVARMVREDIGNFADNLAVARSIWREYRELVEAPGFPDYLRRAYSETHTGDEVDSPVDYGSPMTTPECVEEYRRQAIEFERIARSRGIGR